MSDCSIRLQPGKKYVSRGGTVFGPLHYSDADNEYCFRDYGKIKSWTKTGEYESGIVGSLDLVAEYTEPGVSTDAVNNPAQGRKDDWGKPRVGLIPREALLAEAEVLRFGAQKYAAHNWRKGMAWSRLGDAALRHLLAWLDGEDNDPETGLPHLAHLRCCAGFLLNYAERGVGKDDRHTATDLFGAPLGRGRD